MINVLLTRMLVLFLVIYVVNLLYQKFVKPRNASKTSSSPRVREYTDYDQEEWEKIKKSLEE
jgi:hypothetical protein